MTNEKFTTGEWRFLNGSVDQFGVQLGADGGFMLNYGMPSAKANAHLIAATPDMYRALSEIVQALDMCESFDDLSLIDEFTEEMEQAARAALVKAGGGDV